MHNALSLKTTLLCLTLLTSGQFFTIRTSETISNCNEIFEQEGNDEQEDNEMLKQDNEDLEFIADTGNLSELFQTLSPEEQFEFLQAMEEFDNVVNNESTCSRDKHSKVQGLITRIPYQKVAGLVVRVAIAWFIWEKIQPSVIDSFGKKGSTFEHTAVELPKLIASALIFDAIKDIFKEVRFYLEDKAERISHALFA